MPKSKYPHKNISAGLLMCRKQMEELQFFLVHPGGPYFTQKDEGWWTVPKGLPEEGEEDLLQTACREFEEETGIISRPPYIPLGEIKQKGGKWVHAWAFEGAWDETEGIKCNTFKIEWPYKSGRWQDCPEVDQAGWFSYQEACKKINAAQVPLLDKLLSILDKKQ